MPQPEAVFKRTKLVAGYRKAFPDGWHQYCPTNLRRGVPDLYFTIGAGKPGMWIEAKMGDNGLSKIQAAVTERMVRAGNRVLVVRKLNAVLGAAQRLGDSAVCTFTLKAMPTREFWTFLENL